MKVQEFIEKHRKEPKGYCPCVIDAKGEVHECPKGHLQALLELGEKEKLLSEIPHDVSPLFYMICDTQAIAVDYENQVYSEELTQEQYDTMKELSEHELMQVNLMNIHKNIKL